LNVRKARKDSCFLRERAPAEVRDLITEQMKHMGIEQVNQTKGVA
jgi:hypothetical protein